MNLFTFRFTALISGLALALCWPLGGCASKGSPIQLVAPRMTPPAREFTVMRDLETVWNALFRVLGGEKNRAVQTENKRAGVVTLKPVMVDIGSNCDCGKLGNITLTGKARRRTVLTLTRRAPQETALEIVCNYSMTHQWQDIYGRTIRTETVPCISNGRFERELHKKVLAFMSR